MVHPRLLHPPNLGPGEAAGAELEHSVIGLAGYQVVAPCDINMHRVWYEGALNHLEKLQAAKAASHVTSLPLLTEHNWVLLGPFFSFTH